ncbi:hypothetical protein B0T16DRAFT_406075 [Cercophora newfieldiana]|uniref:Secreted protein n=1 Tax=Cercophora newfieldiana TaxID=92897 RepID=A0AA39YJY5_9PEZI|nr:hypothetical protein B0T16DRAFT_406075 [Cercophora newfieldiana]
MLDLWCVLFFAFGECNAPRGCVSLPSTAMWSSETEILGTDLAVELPRFCGAWATYLMDLVLSTRNTTTVVGLCVLFNNGVLLQMASHASWAADPGMQQHLPVTRVEHGIGDHPAAFQSRTSRSCN